MTKPLIFSGACRLSTWSFDFTALLQSPLSSLSRLFPRHLGIFGLKKLSSLNHYSCQRPLSHDPLGPSGV